MPVLVFLGSLLAANSQSPETFYAANRVKMIVGAPVGGVTISKPMLARHIKKHIPEQPAVIVVNMPGSASVNAANYLANVAPQNGTEMLMVVQTLPIAQLTRGVAARFDLARFQSAGAYRAGIITLAKAKPGTINYCLGWVANPPTPTAYFTPRNWARAPQKAEASVEAGMAQAKVRMKTDGQ